jgi:predicted permease
MGPVAMLLAGATVARYDLVGMLKNKKVYIATALRLVFIPAFLIAVLFGVGALLDFCLGFSIGRDHLYLCFFAMAAPLGLNTVVFPEAYGGNPETGASMALISHTLCIISIPLLYALMTVVFGVPFV